MQWSALQQLQQQLQSANVEIRRQAAYQLCTCKDVRTVESLVMALTQEGQDAQVLYAVGRALVDIGDPRAAPALVGVLQHHQDDFARRRAAYFLGEVGDPQAVEPLVRVLQEERGGGAMRTAAADALGEIGDPRAAEPLIGVLSRGDEWEVHCSVADALGKIGDPQAVEPLVRRVLLAGEGADYSAEAVVSSAARALGKIGDPRAVELLVSALQDKNRSVWQATAQALTTLSLAARLEVRNYRTYRAAGSPHFWVKPAERFLMKDWTGQQVGSYQVVRMLKQGAMADQYLSIDPSSHRPIALFLLAAPTDEAGLFRFQRHLPIIKRLVHPSIAPLLDAGVQSRIPFVALDHLLTSRETHQFPLPISTVIHYVSQIASALSYAHNQGILHLYTTPETIWIGQKNQALLAGFCLHLLQVGRTLEHHREGQLPVPLCYLSPEQLVGQPMSPLSDQYALAAVVYEWLCGVPPFEDAQVLQNLVQFFWKPPPLLREKVPRLPIALERVIMKALAKEPTQRFASVQAFCHALTEASRDRC